MTWNWQHPRWPTFAWQAARLRRAEERFLLRAGVLRGVVGHVGPEERERVMVEAMSEEALTTSAIEGDVLNRESVQSSIRKRLGLASDERRVKPGEAGIAALMVALYRDYAQPISHEVLWNWHSLVTAGRSDLRDVGRYRTHEEPMQIVSGPSYEPRVHFEAPPSDRVFSEMERFVAWFEETSPQAASGLPALTRAGIGHVYFESIHPFEDGNGRVGRALVEKALAQGLGGPIITAISPTIMLRRGEYYRQLEAASKTMEITTWLAWFAGAAVEAQERAIANVEFVVHKAKLLERVRGRLNARQDAVLSRMLREGPAGFKGGMSASKYVVIAKTSSASATRDLGELVDMGALVRTGERKGTRYQLAMPMRHVGRVVVDENGEIRDEAHEEL